MAASIRNTPRSEILYGIGSGLNRIKQALNAQRQRSPIEQQIATGTPMSLGDLLLGEIPEALQDWSYEGSRGPISGRNIQTLKVDPRAVEIAALAIPGGKPAATTARKLAPDAAKLVEKYAIEPYQFNVIKPEGGQWLSDDASGVNRMLNKVREIVLDEDLIKQQTGSIPPETLEYNKQGVAYNAWLDGALKKYIKNRMGSPSDEIRKLADEGITHMSSLAERGPDLPYLNAAVDKRAQYLGIPYEQQATTELGQAWESLADYNLSAHKAKDFSNNREPWMDKLDPDEIVHNLNVQYADGYGFDHMLDVLREDLEMGRIRPEQVNKVSVEQMVRRTHEYDQEMAKKMAETAVKEQAGLPVVKEYPEQGFKWLELNAPDNPELTEKALQYEGEKMGDCVGGYCDLVKSGDTNIFSLRDSKGEPHVTIEIPKGNRDPIADAYEGLDDDTQRAIRELAQTKDTRGVLWGEKGRFLSHDEAQIRRQHMREATLEMFPEWANLQPVQDILQIKGKQNRAPKQDYVPFVQDFLNSREFGEVRDLDGMGLIDLRDTRGLFSKSGKNRDFDAVSQALENLPEGAPRFVTEEQFDEIIAPYLKSTPEQFAAGGLVSGDYDDSRIDQLADEITNYAEGGAVEEEEESITQRIPRYVRKSQYKAAGALGLGPEVEYATEIPERYFPANEQHMGRGDAMRHLLLQAQLQQKWGDLGAYLIGAGHELFSGGQSDAEAEQDEYNDKLGRQIGRESKDRAEATYKALRAVQTGKARVLTKKQREENRYAEGGLVYDESRIDELANQLLGM